MTNQTIQTIADYCRDKLKLETAELSNEYYYQSLPQCVVDAVFSIGVRYGATRNVVERFCRYAKTERYRPHGSVFPERKDQLSMTDFLNLLEGKDYEVLAAEVFGNRQRTSTSSGILKAEAVVHFATEVKNVGIEHFQDITLDRVFALEPLVAKIRGQRSLISFSYFRMLSGDDSQIKPDRWVLRFLAEATGQKFKHLEAEELLQGAAQILVKDYQELTPRKLDHEIWKFLRDKDKKKSTKKCAA